MAESGNGGSATTVTLVVPPGGLGNPGVTTPVPKPHLPFTGFDFTSAVVLAALLLAVGVLLLVTGHRPFAHTRRT
jgi:hypothetical protein